MYELQKNGKVFTSKSVGTGHSSYEKEFTGPWSHNGWETLQQAKNETTNVVNNIIVASSWW